MRGWKRTHALLAWVEEDEDSCSLSHITVVKNVDDLRHISLLG